MVCRVTGRRFCCFDRPVLRSAAVSVRGSRGADVERLSPKVSYGTTVL